MKTSFNWHTLIRRYNHDFTVGLPELSDSTIAKDLLEISLGLLDVVEAVPANSVVIADADILVSKRSRNENYFNIAYFGILRSRLNER